MWRLKLLIARAAAMLRQRSADEEMSREIAAHLAMLEDEYRRRGLSEEEARRAAQRRFGPVERARDLHREARSIVWLDQLQQDLRQTYRILSAHKAYTAAAVLTLALGIGANSAVFSVIYPLMIEPLPFDHPDKLVRIIEDLGPSAASGARGRTRYALPPERADQLSEQAGSLSGVFYSYGRTTSLFERGDAASANVAFVSEGTFSTLRAPPLMGRVLGPRDHDSGAERVAVISFNAWQRYWRGDPEIVGQTAVLDTPLGIPAADDGKLRYRIVGVMPRGIAFPVGGPQPDLELDIDFWVPGDFSRQTSGFGLTTIARVGDDFTIESAEAEVSTLLAGMEIERFDCPERLPDGRCLAGRAELVPIKRWQIQNIRPALLVLIAAVAVVLLIACTNVANLMLARSATRRREISIRSSLGASRGRLARQVLTESLVISFLGGLASTAVAFGGVRLMSTWPGNAPPGTTSLFLRLPRIPDIELDGAVFLFTLLAALLTGLLTSAAPILALDRNSEIDNLKDSASSTSSVPKRIRTRGRNALIVAQAALAMTLLIAAGLLVHSFLKLTSVDPGFDAEGAMIFEVIPSRGGTPDDYLADLRTSLAELPGVASVGYSLPPPFQFSGGEGVWLEVTDGPVASGGQITSAAAIVGEGYLAALGVPIVEGRGFAREDSGDGPAALLVNRRMVLEHFDGRDPVGSRVKLFGQRDAVIVGVVADTHQAGLDSEPYPQIFLLHRPGTVGSPSVYFAVRTTEPEQVFANAAVIARRFDPDIRIENMMSLEELIGGTVVSPRFFGILLTLFAVIGVALAAIGLYGVISFAVTQRTKEIGIRMALGADSRAVLAMVLRQGTMLVAIGITLGLIGAWSGGRYIESLLFGVEPFDLSTVAGAAALFVAIGLLASFVPALRATRVDPILAVRHE